ncbi:DNA mismatch repair protein MutL [Cucurbitaria berberidis CBS 394.84]|uniref:DNA mismatch repair protein PMS1 n=1 Tax=Cucurbitaria berberidis CBS 394.84 TaxID=1168544 RepID=A0A9P4GSI3_9PLEO|nr:DNA mismatch repair protein MutL [Cucurbitaria berberidis CBS 394.84]KAF1850527.1 DNA mismatch repair protein MutL [Cucurbitaria berberidis CBS 394.84]
MATIKAIEGRSVHQIQSGQVIVDLQSVCKELVENSIDAGATSIEVRFRNNGLDAIEVQDNGSGITPDDYETIALKHYTSKLASYDDLASLQTFGFRGEALSSLSALSKFHIITARATDGAKGTKLEFEQSGKLKGTSVVAAKQGTTVAVETLFYNLPVRRKELEKNIKREYNKVLQLLNAYACISIGVKFSVSNQVPKGKKTIAFLTNANLSTKDNISNVYGAKTITALVPLNLEFDMDPSDRPGATQSARNWSTQVDSGSHTVKIVGHISRPVVGEGRQTPDRQMFFVNSRPCNLPQVAKAFNEAYKSFNITQSPFVFADIKLDTNAYDVNVSPDKRTIMLHDQAALLESLKQSLLELFEGHDQSVPQAQLPGQKAGMLAFKPHSIQPRDSTGPTVPKGRSDSERESGDCGQHSDTAEVPSSPERLEKTPRTGFIRASLIDSFAGRDAEHRVIRPLVRRRSNSSQGIDKIMEERVFHPIEQQRSASPDQHRIDQLSPQRSQSPLFEPEKAESHVPIRLSQPSRVVQDFNTRITSQNAHQVERDRSPRAPELDAAEDKAEERIPTITQTPKEPLSQSIIQNAFDRMRPTRTPVQQATITIGDTTTVSTIGSDSQRTSSKRARIHTPKFSLSGRPLDQTPITSLFKKNLISFAAPGTQVDNSDGEESESESGQNSTISDAPIRSPSPHKRHPSKAFKARKIDDLVDSSSTQSPALQVVEENSTEEDIASGAELEPQLEAEKAEDSDDEYIDDTEKKAREEAMIAQMITEAEEAAARPTDLNLKRASKLFKVTQKKYWTINVERVIETDVDSIAQHLHNIQSSINTSIAASEKAALFPSSTQLNKEDPEERLSLTVTKLDFNEMRIIGQFNLGFIIAVRPPTTTSPTSDLFIIDQHASDEKYNFERFSATTTLVPQRLVHPHPLELTAVEQEIILANEHALTANGFVIELNSSDENDTTHRAKLTSLPMSREVTFTPTDLEELLALILDDPPSSSTSTSPHIPRPSKVRKLLASRACRSSVMIGKTLQHTRMKEIVRHMGSMDKPWSCPHGRPTMRHLYGLEKWQGWSEGDGVTGIDVQGGKTDWAAFLGKNRRG